METHTVQFPNDNGPRMIITADGRLREGFNPEARIDTILPDGSRQCVQFIEWWKDNHIQCAINAANYTVREYLSYGVKTNRIVVDLLTGEDVYSVGDVEFMRNFPRPLVV